MTNPPPPGLPADFQEDWKIILRQEEIIIGLPAASPTRFQVARWRAALERTAQFAVLLRKSVEKCPCLNYGNTRKPEFMRCDLCREITAALEGK